MTDSAADLELAKRAARRAGAAAMRHFRTDMAVEYKSPDQPLTAADLEANELLHEDLAVARPEYGWLSEETLDDADRLARQRVWIVDPIDGTRSFIAGRAEFAVSIGLTDGDTPLLGVVYNPATDELFYAVRGAGACIEAGGAAPERLRVSARGAHDDLIMLASRSEIAGGEFVPFEQHWRLARTGSTAYKLACVAHARGEAFLSRGPKSEWDVCAGVLLVEEAGGRVTDLHGARPRFNQIDPYVHGVLATNGTVHDMLLNRIRELPVTERLRPADTLRSGQREEGM